MLWLRLQNFSNCIPCPFHTYIWGVCAHSQVVDGHLASQSHHYLHSHFPNFLLELAEILPDASVTTLWLRLKNLLLHPMSISFTYDVFEHLLRLWMGIWLHTHTNTTTDVSPDLWKLAEILPDASVQTMPLCFGWGCNAFQTASHVHVIHIWEVWVPSQVVDGHMASHSHRYHHRHFPRVVWVAEILLMQVCKPCHYALVEAVEPSKLYPMSMSYMYEVFE